MKILFLCGVFSEKAEGEVINNSKKSVQFSGIVFQRKLINEFQKYGEDFKVLSAPFIGSFPNESRIVKFRGFSEDGTFEYVPFNNMWGFRNFSRAEALKKCLRSFINLKDDRKVIIVYSAHTPFLEAAVYAKKKDPTVQIFLIVPDLPQYMNLNTHISLIYKLGKKYDINRFNRLNRYVDSYMLLTDKMNQKINIRNKPYFVVEGIVEEKRLRNNIPPKNNLKSELFIVYTGTMHIKFGVRDLVDAFMLLPETNYRLVLCGSGDADEYIKNCASVDSRIMALGQVPPDVSQWWQLKADILVNPRPNGEEYVKYSFPSKNLEYLATGSPVVGHMLDGMPAEYKQFMFCIEENKNHVAAIQDAIIEAINCPDNAKKYAMFQKYARKNLLTNCIVSRILNFC